MFWTPETVVLATGFVGCFCGRRSGSRSLRGPVNGGDMDYEIVSTLSQAGVGSQALGTGVRPCQALGRSKKWMTDTVWAE